MRLAGRLALARPMLSPQEWHSMMVRPGILGFRVYGLGFKASMRLLGLPAPGRQPDSCPTDAIAAGVAQHDGERHGKLGLWV